MRMFKVLAAAIVLAIAAAPGAAVAKSHHKRFKKPVVVAATLGTANWFVFGPGRHGKVFHRRWTPTATAGYVVGSIGCAALTPILVATFEQRELSTDEVIWSTATCFFPPLAIIGLVAHAHGH